MTSVLQKCHLKIDNYVNHMKQYFKACKLTPEDWDDRSSPLSWKITPRVLTGAMPCRISSVNYSWCVQESFTTFKQWLKSSITGTSRIYCHLVVNCLLYATNLSCFVCQMNKCKSKDFSSNSFSLTVLLIKNTSQASRQSFILWEKIWVKC